MINENPTVEIFTCKSAQSVEDRHLSHRSGFDCRFGPTFFHVNISTVGFSLIIVYDSASRISLTDERKETETNLGFVIDSAVSI